MAVFTRKRGNMSAQRLDLSGPSKAGVLCLRAGGRVFGQAETLKRPAGRAQKTPASKRKHVLVLRVAPPILVTTGPARAAQQPQEPRRATQGGCGTIIQHTSTVRRATVDMLLLLLISTGNVYCTSIIRQNNCHYVPRLRVAMVQSVSARREMGSIYYDRLPLSLSLPLPLHSPAAATFYT